MLIPTKSQFCAQIFVGMLLLALLPEGSEGITCYSCEGSGCDKPDKSANKVCAADETACFKSGAKKSMKRGCYSKVAADCYRTTGHGGCYPLNAFHEEEVHQCIEGENKTIETPKKPYDTPWFDRGLICVCKGDLCNDGPAKPTGLKCFVSTHTSSNCQADCVVTQICAQGEQCLLRVDRSGAAMERSCFDAEASECFRKKYGTSKELDSDWAYNEIMEYTKNCSGYEVPGRDAKVSLSRQGGYRYNDGFVCVCNTTLCNPATGPASGSKLTLAIILSTTAVYNYIRDLTYF